jgi:CheY-like chemotaxis protein
MLDAVGNALANLGYEVARAESGGRLVDQLASQGPFALIVSDISMPWMDGLKTLRFMRTAGVATPVIVMTGLREQQLPEQVRALGNAKLLYKPFGLDELESAVAMLRRAVQAEAGHPS